MLDWTAMALVGRIARAHGIRGQVIVNLDTDFPEQRFQPGAELFVRRNGVVEPMTMVTVRFQSGRPVVGFAGIETMNDADAITGLELRIPTDRLVSLPAGTFYRHELIGCRVVATDGRDIGVVDDVEGTLGGSRLVVRGDAGEVLVPLAAEICRQIDTAGRRIVVAPPEGLLELNA
jgi:16S rRNA processing protein RimM